MIYSSVSNGSTAYLQKQSLAPVTPRTDTPSRREYVPSTVTYTQQPIRVESGYSLSHRSEANPSMLKSYSNTNLQGITTAHYSSSFGVPHQTYQHQPSTNIQPTSTSVQHHPAPANHRLVYSQKSTTIDQQAMVDSLVKESGRLVAAALDYKDNIEKRNNQYHELMNKVDDLKAALANKMLQSSSKKIDPDVFTIEERDHLLAIIEQQRAEIERLTKKKKKKAVSEEEKQENLQEIALSEEVKQDTSKLETIKPKEKSPVDKSSAKKKNLKELQKSSDLGTQYIKPKKTLRENKKL